MSHHEAALGGAVFSRPTLIGHRGLGRGVVLGHLENTLGSFLAAIESGADWVEVDVRRTADDDLFVWHDPAFADGVFLADIEGSQARERGALPLVELLEALPLSAGVIFDVKSCMEDATRRPTRTTAAIFAAVAQREAKRRPSAATSFDAAAVSHMRQQAPDLPLGLSTWLQFPAEHAVAAAAHLDVQLLALHAGSLWPNPSLTAAHVRPLETVAARLHESQRQLVVWCPVENQSRHLLAAGADALIVDDLPTQALALARESA